MESLDIQNKNIILTGATGAIGGHIAKILANQGANLILVSRREDKLSELLSSLKPSTSNKHITITANVTSLEDVKKIIDTAFDEFSSVDGLLNIAGIPNISLSYELLEKDWDNVIDTNVKSIWLLTSELIKKMRPLQKKNCSIINISSALARRTLEGRTAYATSKAAVEHLTRQLALELAPFDVRVNTVSPGYFRTNFNAKFLDSPQGIKMIESIPLRRTGSLSEIDGIILFLLSNASSYMTGATIDLDGGLSLNRL